jgi:hypothetical protein
MTRKRANGKRASTGRIPAHLRDTDDTTLTITGEDIRPEHAAAIFTTTDQGTTEGVRRNYRSRNRTVIKWLWENYPQAAELSTRHITTEEKSNPHLYYYPQDEYDFVYSGLNPKYILSYLAAMKDKKEGGKYYDTSHMSKFYDAIKWGAGIAKQHLSTEFYSSLDTFNACYKKEWAEQKKRGNVDEREADAINSTLFKLLLKWAINEGNVFVWVFCLVMWHLIARSINVDPMSLYGVHMSYAPII